MPNEEKPTGAPATAEERALAVAQGDDIFNEATTDDTAASNASPEDIEAARVAAEALKEAAEGEGEGKKEDSDPNGNAALAEALKGLAAALPKKEEGKVEETPQLTQEQIDKLLNKFDISDELSAKLDNPETRKAALREFAEGVAREGATAAAVATGAELDKIRQQLAPLLQQAKEQQLAAQKASFVEEYPALADPAYEPILNAVAQDLKASGTTPKTAQEARKILAERAAAAIKSIKPDFDLAAKGTQKTTTKTTTVPKQASVTTKPATGGAGGPKKEVLAEANRSKGTEVFD